MATAQHLLRQVIATQCMGNTPVPQQSRSETHIGIMAQQQRRWVADRITEAINKAKLLKKAARPVFHAAQDIRLAHLLPGNAALRAIYAGKRCCILGTGASLFELDLPVLANEYTFSCNEVFQHPDFDELHLNFYTVVEPFYGKLYGKKYLEDIGKLYGDIDKAFAKQNPVFFFDATLDAYFKQEHLLRGKQLHYVLPKKPLLQADVLQGDLTKRITFAEGAIFTMIAASIYMGFTELYLFGCGYTYSPAQHCHFYDVPRFPLGISEQEEQVYRAEIEKKYAGMGVSINKLWQWKDQMIFSVTLPMAEDMYERHRIVRRFAEERGVRIVNVVPDGFDSPVYEALSHTAFMRDIIGGVR